MNRPRLRIVRNVCFCASVVFAAIGVALPLVMGPGALSARAAAVLKLMAFGGFDARLMKESTRIAFMVGGSCLGGAFFAIKAGVVAAFVLWLTSPEASKGTTVRG